MRTLIVIIMFMPAIASYAQDNDSISKLIIRMEKSALERWNQGDPSGFLEISSKDVVYFDPMREQRLDGLDQLTFLYEKIQGKIRADKYEMVNPKVQAVESMAVLTYNLFSYSGESQHKWNCTEVYRLEKNGKWEIIQTHWSFTKPNIKQ
ncbi:MAG: nuclear transport factor 2 family protein [Bacteroidota bacterium]